MLLYSAYLLIEDGNGNHLTSLSAKKAFLMVSQQIVFTVIENVNKLLKRMTWRTYFRIKLYIMILTLKLTST